jgi:hypothetical protein
VKPHAGLHRSISQVVPGVFSPRAAYLVVIEPDFGFGGLETLFDGPVEH